MKSIASFVLTICLLISLGCQKKVTLNDDDAPVSTAGTTKIVDQIVEASCGECQFGMAGDGCDLAIRIDGKSYYVDGALLDDHGDAHADDGMCNCVRQAKVSGEIKDVRFVSTSFELMPVDKEQQRELPHY